MTKTEEHAGLPISIWPIEKLKPYPKNAKKHPQSHIDLLARSINKQGIANALHVLPDGTIITGHGRWMAAKSLGWATVPVIVRVDLTTTQANALRLSDNQTPSTEYDTVWLQEELQELSLEGFEMDALGFSEAEIGRMTSDFGEIDDESFTDDITTAVEVQREENEKSEAAIDASAAPVGDALGFKRVTVFQSRQIRGFIAKIEAETGKKGAEALLDFIVNEGYGSEDLPVAA